MKMSFNLIFLAFTLVIISGKSVGSEPPGMEISAFLNKVRKEIYEMKQTAESQKQPLFINKMNVELNVAIEREINGGTKIYVLEAGAKANNVVTQKLTFDVYLKQPNASDWEQVKEEESDSAAIANAYAEAYEKAYQAAYKDASINYRKDIQEKLLNQWGDMAQGAVQRSPRFTPYRGRGWGDYPSMYPSPLGYGRE